MTHPETTRPAQTFLVRFRRFRFVEAAMWVDAPDADAAVAAARFARPDMADAVANRTIVPRADAVRGHQYWGDPWLSAV